MDGNIFTEIATIITDIAEYYLFLQRINVKMVGFMVRITDIEQINAYFYQPTVHHLVTVGDLSRAKLALFDPIVFDMYCMVLMDADFGELVKSGSAVRYDAGTMFWLRPGQEVSMNLDYSVKPRGWMLLFKPELIVRTGLGRDFYMFDFFNHDVNGALTLTAAERGIILNCYANIQAELLSSRDYLSDHMIRLGIGVLLSYCKRFFEREYSGHRSDNLGIRERLDNILDSYLSSPSPAQYGQPTVAWCAKQFNLSANYFGDIVKRELHVTARDYIRQKIVRQAKYLLRDTMMSVNEIASELGFDYPTHFARMFRQETKMSPQEYRKMSRQAMGGS